MRAPAANSPLLWLRTVGRRRVFLFAYALLMLTILEQGRMIRAQQILIRQLYPDSLELSHVKAHR